MTFPNGDRVLNGEFENGDLVEGKLKYVNQDVYEG